MSRSEVACRATSIKQQIDDLTRLVLRWRKMELHAWPRLLECAASQAHEKALSRVWVRLFRVVHAGAAGSVPEDDDGGGGGEQEDDDETAQDDETADAGAADAAADADAAAAAIATPSAETDLAEHLREFYAAIESLMLSSSAGAWEAHLKLLTTFETQLRVEGRLGSDGTAAADEAADEMEEAMEAAASAERRRRRAGYAAILHNVAAYYRQFTEKLRGAVTAQMGPIETKLTDFIKLGQWSDRNFAALSRCAAARRHAAAAAAVGRQGAQGLQEQAGGARCGGRGLGGGGLGGHCGRLAVGPWQRGQRGQHHASRRLLLPRGGGGLAFALIDLHTGRTRKARRAD